MLFIARLATRPCASLLPDLQAWWQSKLLPQNSPESIAKKGRVIGGDALAEVR